MRYEGVEKVNKNFAIKMGVYERMSEGDKWLFDLLDRKQYAARMLLFYKYQRVMYDILKRYQNSESIEKANRETASSNT